MQCRDFLNNISAWMDGVSDVNESREMDSHAAVCRGCGAVVRVERKAREALLDLAADDVLELPAGFRDSVMEAVRKTGSLSNQRSARLGQRWARGLNADGKTIGYGTGRLFGGAFRSLRAAALVVVILSLSLLISLGIQRLHNEDNADSGSNGLNGSNGSQLLADASDTEQTTEQITRATFDSEDARIEAYPDSNYAGIDEDNSADIDIVEENADEENADEAKDAGANDPALIYNQEDYALDKEPTTAALIPQATAKPTTAALMPQATDSIAANGRSGALAGSDGADSTKLDATVSSTESGLTGSSVESDAGGTLNEASVIDENSANDASNARPERKDAADDDAAIRRALMNAGVMVIYSGASDGAEIWEVLSAVKADGTDSVSAGSAASPAASVSEAELAVIVAMVEKSLSERDYAIEVIYPDDAARLLRIAVEY